MFDSKESYKFDLEVNGLNKLPKKSAKFRLRRDSNRASFLKVDVTANWAAVLNF